MTNPRLMDTELDALEARVIAADEHEMDCLHYREGCPFTFGLSNQTVFELITELRALQGALDRFEQAGLYMEMLYPQIWDSALGSALNPLAGEV